MCQIFRRLALTNLLGSGCSASLEVPTTRYVLPRAPWRATCLQNFQGEEVLHLPVIVEAAESSPAAAREAANVIRKFLGKENYLRAYVQYNAIMVIRILADNPGESFTRNLGGKFVVTTKELLRDGRDMSVQQILRETLDTFQLQKSQDEGLQPLITMWQNEKAKMAKRGASYVAPAVSSGTLNPPSLLTISSSLPQDP